jgi:tRNA(Ile)-lysidine synthase
MASVSKLERQVAGALVRAGYSGSDTVLVVAVSGGSDSLALLHCLHRLSNSHRLHLHVAHLNHDFRGQEAFADARFVAAAAQDLGLPATVEERDVAAIQRERRISSFEQAARELRYSFLAEVAARIGAAAVTAGHTADDQAETVLMHILRGAGLHGLRGMSELSPWPWSGDGVGLHLFRPLLQATKAETVAYCRALGLDYRDDTGNYLHRFTRNRVRHGLLPLLESEYNPGVRESLARLARTAALETDYLEDEVARLWPDVAEPEDGAVVFRQPALSGLHPALRRLLLRRGYVHLMGDTRKLGEGHLTAMDKLAGDKAAGRSLDLPGGLKLHSTYGYLRLSRDFALPCPFPGLDGEHHLVLPSGADPEVVGEAGPWRVSFRVGGPPRIPFNDPSARPFPVEGRGLGGVASWSAWLDRGCLGDVVQVRTRAPGDRFQPLGMDQDKKLQDFFTDARVPGDWRDRVPLLVSSRGIAWVVGYRIAHWARLREGGPASVEAVRVEFEAIGGHGRP